VEANTKRRFKTKGETAMTFDSMLVIGLIVAGAVVISLRFDAWIMGWLVAYFGRQEDKRQ
jgi:hypothetical protein